jgi:opacity protein-like surface antigen
VKNLTLVIGAFLLLAACAQAQHGTAGNGYFPPGYSGDTWTGTVTSANDDTREITLTYVKGDKQETFTGVLKAGLKATRRDGSQTEWKPSDIPIGSRIIVYYMAQSKKVEGKKVKYYEIFQFTSAPKDSK